MNPVQLLPFLLAAVSGFRADVDRFLEAEFRLFPERATHAGDHRFDDRLSDLSASGVEARLRHAAMWKERFARIEPKGLPPAEAADREWAMSWLDGELLEADLRSHERNPNLYVPTAAVNALMVRDFAPPEERLRSIAARERAALANLAAARQNLKPARVPRVSVEIALDQMPSTLSFFRKDVPAAFASVPAGPSRKSFEEANAALLAALESYESWLRKELLPAASGKIAIGAPAFSRMIAAHDMVDEPLDRLEEIGDTELARLLAQFRETAARIDASRDARAVFEAIAKSHPSAQEVVPGVRAQMEEIRGFVAAHRIATIPSESRPTVRETPPFQRATTFASMDVPGPFEKKEEAFFHVTLPDPSWPAERSEQLLQFYSAPSISDLIVHEAYPGHFIQFLHARRLTDPLRSVLFSGANAEGWALYSEEMMLEEGLRGDDPKYRLAQIQMALQRACRYLVAIRMHTKGMSLEDAAAFFEKNAMMTPNNARVEARRGTQDPGYLRYQLGKLMIRKLRDDVKKKEGAAFDLSRFHDRFLDEGAVPVKLIRRAMLGSDAPQL
jgi:uncharacterized protein (DUF885 family)